MSTASELISKARKIVIKYGSSTLTDKDGNINTVLMDEMAEQISILKKNGKQIVLVSSGAQVAGLSTMHTWARKKDIHYRQALCAVGQVELMRAWAKSFWQSELHIAQILLTQEDFGNPNRTLNIRNTLFTLVDEGIIPVINENDSVCVEEIKIGDNDTLAAHSAILWSADLLILFSDIDGLYNKNPKDSPDAEFVPEVKDIAEIRKSVSFGAPNNFGTGGIATKISAAEKVIPFGIHVILAHGGKPRALENLANGNGNGTAFLGPEIS